MESRQHRLQTCSLFCFVLDHRVNVSMAMEQRFRNYSSDSVSSDGVFIEEPYYQGMLRAMDHRKGRVYSAHFVSVILTEDCVVFLI